RPRRPSAPTWLEPVRVRRTDAGRGERAAGRAVLREDLLEQRERRVRVVVVGGGVQPVQPGRQARRYLVGPGGPDLRVHRGYPDLRVGEDLLVELLAGTQAGEPDGDLGQVHRGGVLVDQVDD